MPKLLTVKLIGILTFLMPMLYLSRSSATTVPPPSTHSVTLAWDAVPDSVVTGYRVMIGISSGQYMKSYDVGLTTDFLIDGLEFGKTYYAVVSSLGVDDFESSPSAELAFTVAPPPLPLNTQAAIDASGQCVLQWNYPKAALTYAPEFIIQASPDLIHWTEVETISAEHPSVEENGFLKFMRPTAMMGTQMFYRLTARNWMGDSTGP
jgi:hypothetical protein